VIKLLTKSLTNVPKTLGHWGGGLKRGGMTRQNFWAIEGEYTLITTLIL